MSSAATTGMILYLIGPSGVGKTSCAIAAVSTLDIEHIDLDGLCRNHQFDWPICKQALESLENQQQATKHRIVDIGAGTQTLPQLRGYVRPRASRTVLIWAPAAEVLLRNPLGPRRARDEYERTEYTSRADLYSLAEHRVDVTGMNRSEPASAVARTLSDILSTS